MPQWDAEIGVDERLVRTLLTQFDELALDAVERLAEGWDRSAWLVDGRWVFGFPRRAVVVPGLERELEFLPRLAPLLPAPIPDPVFVGRPSSAFPWPFFGSAFLPGEEAIGTPPGKRRAVALDLAEFLRRLHSPAVADAVGYEALPDDPVARADMRRRVPKTRQALADLGPTVPDFRPLLDEAELLPPPEQSAVVHGDLHARQFLVDAGRVSGVIDWIDLARADPAVDLNVAWAYLEPADRDAFFAAYGPVTEAQHVRARVVAVSLAAMLARSAADFGLTAVEREARAALERVATA